MDESNIELLLSRVAGITKKYEEIAEITGENFNVFSILDIKEKESTHSRFITELLNPKGTHGLKDVFLKLFINQCIGNIETQEENEKKEKSHSKGQNSLYNLSLLKKFTLGGSSVEREHYLGLINTDSVEGGRIDILIQNRNNSMIIENKINAGDQATQLIRYKKAFKKSVLFYLTKHGTNPWEGSIVKDDGNKLIKNKDFFCISYKDDILNWLEECKKETSDYPLLRETLTQYINTIKDLTGQSKNKKMGKEIDDIILEGGNISAAKKIKEAIERIEDEASTSILRVFQNLKSKIGDKVKELNKDEAPPSISIEILPKEDTNEGVSLQAYIDCEEKYTWGMSLYGSYNRRDNEKIVAAIADVEKKKYDRREENVEFVTNEIYEIYELSIKTLQ